MAQNCKQIRNNQCISNRKVSQTLLRINIINFRGLLEWFDYILITVNITNNSISLNYAYTDSNSTRAEINRRIVNRVEWIDSQN